MTENNTNDDWFDPLDELDFESEIVTIPEAAAECGVPLHVYLSWLVNDGMLLEMPDSIDPRCQPGGDERFPDMRMHVADCECEFIPVPHPDIREL